MDAASPRESTSDGGVPTRRPKRRWRRRTAVGLGLLALALALGTRRLPMAPDYPGPVSGTPLPAFPHGPRSVAASFRQERLEVAGGRGHQREIWSFAPSGLDTNHEPQQVEWYRPATSPAVGPAILVLPILGGDYPVERIVARHLAREGFSAVLARRTHRFSQYRQVEGLNDLLGSALEDHLRVVDWMSARPEIDRTRIGCLGLSVGAIQGCLVSGVDPRIRATVLGLGGGDLPYILARSKDFDLARRRRKMLAPLGWSIPEYEARLRDEIEWDPLRVASRIDARRVLLIQARFDLTIPPPASVRLREAMGGPETLLLPAGHYDSAVFLPFILREVSGFFRKHLAEGAPSSDPAVPGGG